jgi:citrate synthase
MNQPSAAPTRDWLSAGEAADLLGVRRATLYAYVSRGLLSSADGDGPGRDRRYRRRDVERLARERGRRAPAAAVREALGWSGLPVLDTAVSEISDRELRYRGRLVGTLVRTATFPQVAALLWDVEHALPTARIEAHASTLPLIARGAFCEAFQVALALAAADDLRAFDLRPEALRAVAPNVLALMLSTAAGRPVDGDDPAALLAAAWCDRPGTAELLDAALILSADHELNVSTFTARCVASAGASLYAVVGAAAGALSGGRHGRQSEAARAMLDDAEASGARPALEAALRRHGAAPGFGHPLYPAGDPRGRLLLGLLAEHAGERSAAARELASLVEQELHLLPSLELALAALASALDLPRAAELALFAVGRSTGWIAHALEQYEADGMIRPRARYVGS